MANDEFKLQKRAGKAEFSGRRRSATKRSGFKSHSAATGGRYTQESADKYSLAENGELLIRFQMPNIGQRKYSAFGFYYQTDEDIHIETEADGVQIIGNLTTRYSGCSWNKCGYLWRANHPSEIIVTLRGRPQQAVFLYDLACGEVWHEYFMGSREAVIKNLHKFAPESNFYTSDGVVEASQNPVNEGRTIYLKECNRCARLLPVNFENERDTLSFSNHCVARRPCKHKGFGILESLSTGEITELEYGFQLECRVCKKFAVNAALNPQRTGDQMKEDAQRRRHFELLIMELNDGSKQLQYRHEHGIELATLIWEKFGKSCFSCGIELKTLNEMNLDHTRPLALLWPLDETATALCKDCNSSKRDRYPSDYYSESKLTELSTLTGIPLNQLTHPSPNMEVLELLMQRIDWVIGTFLNKEFLKVEKGGKVSSELICKALDRVISQSIYKDSGFSFVERWNDRRF